MNDLVDYTANPLIRNQDTLHFSFRVGFSFVRMLRWRWQVAVFCRNIFEFDGDGDPITPRNRNSFLVSQRNVPHTPKS